jgi:hypothetical protein
MAQFDSLIIFPLVWSLLLTLIFHYNILIGIVIPNFFGAKKFRDKKLDSVTFGFFSSNSVMKISNSYNNLSF